METPKDADEVIEVCEFPVVELLQTRPNSKNALMKRYFIGTTDKRIYALFRATFEERTLVSEETLQMPNGKQWIKTKEVSRYLILGGFDLDEVDLAVIQTHLPAGVSA
jgi:hypothetical protein